MIRSRPSGGAAVEELVPPWTPDPGEWAGALLDALAPATGTTVAFAARPTLLPHRAGPWAFGCELVAGGGGALPSPAWRGPLTVRVADDPAETAREEAAVQAMAAAGRAAPRPLARVALDAGTVRSALVMAPPAGTPLPELIGFNLRHSDDLLGGFARYHAEIHAVPVDPLQGLVPPVELVAELGRIDRRRFGEEVAWLEARAPEPAPLVLGHGGYQPMCVTGPGPDAWDAAGGPGSGLAAEAWSGAVLVERELDVAFTLVAFWCAPFFAPSRSERTAIKMIRNTLANTYRLAYESAAPLDADRLRYWQAFHAVRGLARLAGAYDPHGSPYAATDRGPLPAVLAPELKRYFRMQHRP